MSMELTPITVPATSRLRYLGGMAALNLPSPTGTGDWHVQETFFRQREKRSRSFISGAGCPTDTISVLGEAGIYDCTAVLERMEGLGAQTADSVTFSLREGPRVEWGSADDSALKAQVLTVLLDSGQAPAGTVVDVSAPTLPITRSEG